MLTDPIIRHNRWQAEAFGLPGYAYRTWLAGYQDAKQAGIPFRFTVHEWFWWWSAALREIGPEARYGLRKGDYRMVRVATEGAYEVGNVMMVAVPSPPRISRSDRMRQWHAEHVVHLKGKVGAAHPRSRPVQTPRGRFSSLSEAAEAFGVSRQRVCQYLGRRKGRTGWHYLNGQG